MSASKKGYTKDDRIKAIAAHTGIDARAVREVLDYEDEVIADALKQGKRVYLDNIGTLVVRDVEATRKHIPGKGVVDIPAHRKPKFTPSITLLERL